MVMALTTPAARALARITPILDTLPAEDVASVLTALRDYTITPLSDAARGSFDAPHGAAKVHQKVIKGAAEVHQEGGVGGCVSDLFLQFWSAYPRKVGKQDALRIYWKIKPNKELQDRILQAIHEQKASEQWTKEDGRFIPLPKTWLHRGSWDDEPVQIDMNLAAAARHTASINGDGKTATMLRGLKNLEERHARSRVGPGGTEGDGEAARSLSTGGPERARG